MILEKPTIDKNKQEALPQELYDILNGKKQLKVKMVNYGTPQKIAELKTILELQKKNMKRGDMNVPLNPIIFK
ncbi:MAG: hypothetical protein NTX91_04595 [candidate division SR1 bacterium]|nr:hypothetical protein [candidate division SR1 bacterium]